MEHQIKKLPKAELHCHLDGSISLDVIRELAAKENIALPAGDIQLQALTMAPADCMNLKQYLDCFGLAVACMQTEDTLRLAAYRLMEEAAAENLIYLEIRFAPHLHQRKGLSLTQIVESVLIGLEEGRRQYAMEYGLILCAMRDETIEHAAQVLELAVRFKDKRVVAIDLAGNEADYPVTIFSDIFKEAAGAGVPFTIHAGEAAGADSVRNAVDLGAARIGHGIAACRDKGLLRECKAKGIVFEFCPSSNLQTKAAAGWEEYPFPVFYEAGMAVTINTDNRRVTGTSMTRELSLICRHYGLAITDVRHLICNAVDGAFAGTAVKHKLKIITNPH